MFEALFKPVQIGSLSLKNRVIMGPLGTAMADENQNPTPEQVKYYAERAKGGVGLVVFEHTAMQKMGARSVKATGIWDRSGLPIWKQITEAIHSNGAKAGIQIGHQGPCTDYSRLLGGECAAPSHIRCYKIQEKTRPVTLAEMEQFKEDYVRAVKIAKEAGFDTVMLHFTNGYFLASWLSGRTNKRTDRYGGTLENRLRFPLELIERVRDAVGPDYPLIVRLASREVNGGRSLEETRVIARALEQAGINALDINAGSWSEYDWEFPSYYQPEGFLLEDVQKIKESVSIPVIGGGRIIEPMMAEQALKDGRCDLVSITRGMLADPEWLLKTAAGETGSIRRCIACTRCINDREHGGLVCSVNPFERKEEVWAIKPAADPKKICVIGAGPAGLQAAVVAARRGHQVTVAERSDMPGGMVKAAGIPPLKWGINSLISALAYDAEKYGVNIHYGLTATPEWILQGGFDHVVVATGAKPIIPSIPNDGSLKPVTAVDILLGKEWAGQRVAIIGGGMIGCETADFLSKYRRSVTIFEMLDRVAGDMYPNIRDNMMAALKEADTKLVTSAKVLGIENGRVLYEIDGKRYADGPYDTLVYAVGMQADHTLADKLKEKGVEPIVVGDAVRACKLYEALTSAVEAVIHL